MKSPQTKSATDFRSLDAELAEAPAPYQGRSIADLLIDVLTPLMIFVMVSSVVHFLLDVRYVYTEVHDWNLRWFAFCFVMGIVGLNRLIAREGGKESVVYAVALAGAIGMYTLATTGLYDVGSVARKFMNEPLTATGFNMLIVAFIWWLANRLTHECCVDTNPLAGDVGILTGTARRMRKALEEKPLSWQGLFGRRTKEPLILSNLVEPVDPTEWRKPGKRVPPPPMAATERLSKRHPGISVFYFSVPVMFIFAVGQRVVQHGGRDMILAGHLYLGCYTVSALMLLMLSSLGGLREYFRTRRTHIPAGLAPFWIGLGTVMLIVVLVGAAGLPLPAMPPIAHVDYHEVDFWTRGSQFRLVSVVTPAVNVLKQAEFMEHVGQGVLGVIGLFLVYGLLQGLGAVASAIARNRRLFPPFIRRFFAALDRLLKGLIRVPRLPQVQRRRRVGRDVALCARYSNPLADPAQRSSKSVADFVEFAYDALCALAYDLGVPRHQDQTPYEFVESFPSALKTLQEEAIELTNLYVVSAYSPESLDERVLDRLRKFWLAYDIVRNRVLK